MTLTADPTDIAERRDALAGRLFQTTLAALDLWAVYLGHHLGYYRVLADRGQLNASGLGEAAGTHERYTREWLEQQAATGILTVDEAGADPADRRYRLGTGHAEVLLDPDSLSYLIPLVRYYQATALLIPQVVEAHRSGGGIPWTDMGDEVREAQEGFNRALFLRQLTSEDLPAVPDVDARLRAEPPARVADVGCGAGWASIAIARAYPGVRVDGFDFDPAAIATARRNAAHAGLSDRVCFEVRRSDDTALAGRYNLVTFFECVHDFARPVEALAAARRLLSPGGTVIVMDEAVEEEFAAPANDVDRMMYGWSLVQCLPGGMADQPSAATGAVMRPATLRRYAEEAGYASTEILPIANDPIRRWYRLRP
jgi:2-polyprenyl-3-methyl-5-hydroxy-6-metoxy-1,4-benzoquinol methylase